MEDGTNNDTCFWLKNASSSYGGKCYDVKDSGLKCSNVTDPTECTDDILGGTTLDGKCFVNDTTCQTKCEKLTDSGTETCASRSADCVEILNVGGGFEQCINKVCCD
jgi:hypothetical protein